MPETSNNNLGTQSVTLFATCMIDQMAPAVGESTVEVLEHLGLQVKFVDQQTCCGQPAFNSGFRSESLPVAQRFLELFEAVDGPIIVPSGSCAAMVRNFYTDLFRDDQSLVERANTLNERLYEFTEFIDRFFGSDAIAGSCDDRVTYHKCCHLLREIGIDEQPLEMLSNIDGLEMTPMNRADVCCGFGGAFSVKMPDISSAILEEKLDNIEATKANRVVAGDIGCIYQIEGGLRRRGSTTRVLHLAEILSESIRNMKTGKATE